MTATTETPITETPTTLAELLRRYDDAVEVRRDFYAELGDGDAEDDVIDQFDTTVREAGAALARAIRGPDGQGVWFRAGDRILVVRARPGHRGEHRIETLGHEDEARD